MNEDELKPSVSNETPATESTELNESIETTIAPEASGDNLSGEEVDKW